MLNIGLTKEYLLAINVGSSSIKASLYLNNSNPYRLCDYNVTLIGTKNSKLIKIYNDKPESKKIHIKNHLQAMNAIMQEISYSIRLIQIKAVGHRIVHGGIKYSQPTKINNSVLSNLEEISLIDPEHLPKEIEIIKYSRHLLSKAIHYAIFDTFFFKDLPAESYTLPINNLGDKSIRKYGFHGLSYEYSLNYIAKNYPSLLNKKIIIAHLGSGSSITAINNKTPLDTTMSFSPSSGILMSSRTGDIDPSVIIYLQKKHNLTSNQLSHLVNHQSGLLSVSNKTADMEKLIASTDDKSKLAVNMFCNHAIKIIGGYISLLNGIDAIVFSGGIGENAPVIRNKILSNFSYLNLNINDKANNTNNEVISSVNSNIKALVFKTNEQEIIINTLRKVI